jgi:hypothetical protein
MLLLAHPFVVACCSLFLEDEEQASLIEVNDQNRRILGRVPSTGFFENNNNRFRCCKVTKVTMVARKIIVCTVVVDGESPRNNRPNYRRTPYAILAALCSATSHLQLTEGTFP